MSSIRSKVGHVACVIPFNATNSPDTSQPDLNLAKTGISESVQKSTVMQANNCTELLLYIKLASGEINIKMAAAKAIGSDDPDLNFETPALDFNVTDTYTHFRKISITPEDALDDASPAAQYPLAEQVLANLLYQLKITETDSSTYEIAEFMLMECSAIQDGRDYHVVTAGFGAIPKDGAGANWDLEVVADA